MPTGSRSIQSYSNKRQHERCMLVDCGPLNHLTICVMDYSNIAVVTPENLGQYLNVGIMPLHDFVTFEKPPYSTKPVKY